MDPIDTLLAALEAEPGDRAARCALIDELMERYGYSRHGAASRAGALISAARKAKDMAEAAGRIDGRLRNGVAHRYIILHAARVPGAMHLPVDVVPGTCMPCIAGEEQRCEYPDGSHCPDPRAAFATGIKVTYTPDTRRVIVGALWVLKHCTGN